MNRGIRRVVQAASRMDSVQAVRHRRVLMCFLVAAISFGLAPSSVCFGQEAQWDVKYTTPKREYLQQEPVRMNMEWRNTGSKPQVLPEGGPGWTPLAIGVAGPGADKEIHPYTLLQGYERVRQEELADAVQPMVHVPPGGIYKLSTWILVGTSGVVKLSGAGDPKGLPKNNLFNFS